MRHADGAGSGRRGFQGRISVIAIGSTTSRFFIVSRVTVVGVTTISAIAAGAGRATPTRHPAATQRRCTNFGGALASGAASLANSSSGVSLIQQAPHATNDTWRRSSSGSGRRRRGSRRVVAGPWRAFGAARRAACYRVACILTS